tara:strand:- start:180 stop:407 length:228 start_codon:yes stop_codon:yes gene_type:complete
MAKTNKLKSRGRGIYGREKWREPTARGAFGRNKTRSNPINERIAALGKKKLELRRRLLDYVREGHLTHEEMVAAL